MTLPRLLRQGPSAEPHYTNLATEQLRRYGFTTEIDRALQEEIYTEWTWGDYPMPWCSREEICAVGAEAQRIHDDIAAGRLAIHLHADYGLTTVAVGSYATGARRHVHPHGENHLRQQTDIAFDTEAEAIAEFHRFYSVAVRPGPAPLTSLEQAVRQLLAGEPRSATEETSGPTAEPPVAEYDGPVGERLWHATVTTGTPVPLIRAMLQHLDTPPHATAGHPDDVLRDAAWHPASHSARTTWEAPGRSMIFESPRTPWPTDGCCTAGRTSTGRHGTSAFPTEFPRISWPSLPRPPPTCFRHPHGRARGRSQRPPGDSPQRRRPGAPAAGDRAAGSASTNAKHLPWDLTYVDTAPRCWRLGARPA